jgi:hypothetical protein
VGSGNAAQAHLFDHRLVVVGMHERQEGHKCHVKRADVEAALLARVSDLSRAALMDASSLGAGNQICPLGWSLRP